MREAFTPTLKQTLDYAQREARAHNQEFVGTDHLFLAVIHCHDCEAERVLRLQHLNPAELRAVVMRDLPKADESPVISGELPLSPKAQRVINGAIVKAQALRESRISTRFLLLSLLDEPNTLVRSAISAEGGDVNQLRQALVETPGDEEA
jgi:ATP-dependent Clp protease ATP-binding subunit ClpC